MSKLETDPTEAATLVRQFRTDGYAIERGMLDLGEIAAIKDKGRRLLEANHGVLGLPPNRGSDLEKMVLCVQQVHKLSPAIVQLGRDPRIVRILNLVIGEHVKLMQSQYFCKAPGMPGNGWHQDEAKIPTRDRSLVAAWVGLDEASLVSGCLQVVPGSHASGYLYPEEEHGAPDRWDFPAASAGFNLDRAVSVETSPGDVVFFDGYLVHGSEPNRSDHLRRAVTFHYMNAYSLLPWKAIAHHEGERIRPADLDYRDVLIVSGEDPYAWKGYTDESRPHLRKWGAIGGGRAAQRDCGME